MWTDFKCLKGSTVKDGYLLLKREMHYLHGLCGLFIYYFFIMHDMNRKQLWHSEFWEYKSRKKNPIIMQSTKSKNFYKGLSQG